MIDRESGFFGVIFNVSVTSSPPNLIFAVSSYCNERRP